MSNSNGWGLTARLISKHFGALGDRVSEAIANFDPETATEADRDRLADSLRSTAQKLAAARASFDKEAADVVKLRQLIATDEQAAGTLADRLASGKISEATITLFCDELEAKRSASVPAACSSVAISWRSLTTSAASLSKEARAAASFCAVVRRLSARRSRSASVAVSGSKLAIASDTRSPNAPKCLEIRRAVKPQPFELLMSVFLLEIAFKMRIIE